MIRAGLGPFARRQRAACACCGGAAAASGGTRQTGLGPAGRQFGSRCNLAFLGVFAELRTMGEIDLAEIEGAADSVVVAVLAGVVPGGVEDRRPQCRGDVDLVGADAAVSAGRPASDGSLRWSAM